jgi:hypothetical protein
VYTQAENKIRCRVCCTDLAAHRGGDARQSLLKHCASKHRRALEAVYIASGEMRQDVEEQYGKLAGSACGTYQHLSKKAPHLHCQLCAVDLGTTNSVWRTNVESHFSGKAHLGKLAAAAAPKQKPALSFKVCLACAKLEFWCNCKSKLSMSDLPTTSNTPGGASSSGTGKS